MFRFITLLIVMTLPALSQQISYIIPDIGSAGMNTYVEIIAPYNANGNFGANGLYLNNPTDNVRIELVRQADTAKMCFGPLVVSWNGRMISSQAMINPFVSPNSEYWYNLTNEFRIPYRVYVNGSYSNVDTFYLVKPFQFGDVSGAAHWEIGSGILGVRSRRGAMITGYTKFANSNYGVAINDCDPYVDGNQAYLPFILLSKEAIEGNGANTFINVSGNGRHAGPGGGGGGGRFCDGTILNPSIIGDDGGNGFTGGGPGGRNNSGGASDAFKAVGTGTGSNGASLNMVPAPVQAWTESSGGGTGHPFGLSGQGCGDGNNCDPASGYGGGSGYRQHSRGGAGGYRTNGANSSTQNGGNAHGSDDGIPIAGGSGGASGNPQSPNNCSGSGGGAGGAVRVSALSLNRISIRAIGADGGASSYGAQAAGGAGSGGYTELGAKLLILNSSMYVSGGNAGMGGIGLTRIDSPFKLGTSSGPTGVQIAVGLTTDSTSNVLKKFKLTGSKSLSGDSIRLYIKSNSTVWQLDTVLIGLNGNTSWERNYYLPGQDSVYYIVAVADRQRYSEQPTLVSQQYLMSQSAANIIFKNKNPEILSDSNIRMKSLACEGKSVQDSFYIYNNGDAGLELNFNTSSWKFGNRGFSLLSPLVKTWVNPNDSVKVVINYSYRTGQRGIIRDTLDINHNDFLALSRPLRIACEVTLDSVVFNLLNSSQIVEDTLDFGKLCINDSLKLNFFLNNNSSILLRASEILVNYPEFRQINDLRSGVLPGNKALGIVRFQPSRVGKINGKLIYVSNDCAEVKDSIILVGEGISGEFEFEKPLHNRIDTLNLDSYCVGGSVHGYFLVRSYGGQELNFPKSQQITTTDYIYKSTSVGQMVSHDLIAQPKVYWDTIHYDIWPLREGPIEFKVGLSTVQCGGYQDTLVIKLNGVRGELTYTGTGDFGVRIKDTRDTLDVSFKNTGSANLWVESLKPLNPPFSYLQITPSLPVLLKPGDLITAKIEFYPRTDGFYSDSLTPMMVLSDSTCIDYKRLDLKGIATSSQLILSDDTLRFEVLAYCDEIQDSLIITNPTTVILHLTNPDIVGPDASYFDKVQGFNPSITLNPGESAVFYIRFNPRWGPDGIKRATFTVSTDDPQNPTMTCELIGEQENLKVTANPPDLNFGSVPLFVQRQQTIRLTNNGLISQNLKNVVINNPDMSAAPTAGNLAANGGTLDVNVTYRPTIAGNADSDILFIFRNLRDGKEKCEDTLKTKIYAVGQEGQVLVTPRILYELKPPCQNGYDSMEVTNTGASTITIDSMIITGADAGYFAFADAATMPDDLDSGEVLRRYVSYDASSPGNGIKRAMVLTFVNVGGKTKTDTTTLTVEKRDFIISTPDPLDFGNVVVGQFNELDLTLRNTGNSPVVISGIKLPVNATEFFFNPSPVGLVINGNSAQNVKVRFIPSAAVQYNDRIGVTETYISGCTDSTFIDLIGTGIPPVDTRIIIDEVGPVDPRDYSLIIPIRAFITNPVAAVNNIDFNARISFNATMYHLRTINNATITNDSIAGNIRYVDFRIIGISLSNDTSIIASLNGRPLLGNSDFTMINWESFGWKNQSAFGITDTIPGSITTEICSSGGNRLLVTGFPLEMMIAPNPAGDEINIKIKVLETGKHTIRIINPSGESRILQIIDVKPDGAREFEFHEDLDGLSTGYYFITVSSPTDIKVQPVLIIK